MSYQSHLKTAGSKLLRFPSDRQSSLSLFSVRTSLHRTHRGSSIAGTQLEP
jgi:hypothetical protein